LACLSIEGGMLFTILSLVRCDHVFMVCWFQLKVVRFRSFIGLKVWWLI